MSTIQPSTTVLSTIEGALMRARDGRFSKEPEAAPADSSPTEPLAATDLTPFVPTVGKLPRLGTALALIVIEVAHLVELAVKAVFGSVIFIGLLCISPIEMLCRFVVQYRRVKGTVNNVKEYRKAMISDLFLVRFGRALGNSVKDSVISAVAVTPANFARNCSATKQLVGADYFSHRGTVKA